jgi:hypothetical protein
MQNIHNYQVMVAKEEKNGHESRLLLLGKMKHLPENERVSFAKENRIQ